MGICPFAGAFADQVITRGGYDAVVATTLCDQMRRVAGALEPRLPVPLFLFNLPSTWEHEGPERLYRDELARFGLFLSTLGGIPPSREKLANQMLLYARARQRMQSLRASLTGTSFLAMLAHFHENGPTVKGEEYIPGPRRGLPLAIIGGPALACFHHIFQFIEERGGLIVLDGTDTGERSFPGPFDMDRARDDPIGELTKAYFATIPHPFRRPNTFLYSWLRKEIPERDVKGVILLRHSWCDIWHAEVMELRKSISLPLLDLELNNEDYDGAGISCRTANRILSFLEVIE